MTNKEQNTTALLTYFADYRARVEADTEDKFRDITIKSARDSEWHTLFSCLMIPHLAAIHDTIRIAERLDEMKNAMMRDAGVK